jgi:hypothetical protein
VNGVRESGEGERGRGSGGEGWSGWDLRRREVRRREEPGGAGRSRKESASEMRMSRGENARRLGLRATAGGRYLGE